MAEIARVALFGKLDKLAYQALEGATVFCRLRGNPYVELSHWIHQILQQPDSDLHHVVRHFQLDASRVAKELTEALDRLPRGSTSVSDLSGHVEDAVERGWVYGSLLYQDPRVRTGHLLVGILKTPALRNVLAGISRELSKVGVDRLTDDFLKLLHGSPESAPGAQERPGVSPPGEAGSMAPAPLGKQEALARFSVDLTARARNGEIDPILGRDAEIRQIVDILMRRRQNNPILTGEAGVGKTAVVEGFALRIVAQDVPPALREVAVRALDVGLLQAGASMKGEFESRLRQVIDEVQASPKPVILFIDEAHTLIGAGGAAGTGDAANLLKPALARGTLRTIAATTWAEYKKHIEKDPALTRRFQVVQIAEPTEDRSLTMMRGIVAALEKHHRVHVLDEALESAVKLSHRYIPTRQLPDKAVSLLDTACARVAISQHSAPPAVEDARHTIEALNLELEIIGREQAVGIDVAERVAQARKRRTAEEARLAGLEARWTAERALVDQILALRVDLRGLGAEGANTPRDNARDAQTSRESLLQRLRGLLAELARLQEEEPMILPSVDAQAIASVVADWTGIPVGRMIRDEVDAVLKLPATLGARVIGQDHALEMIAQRIQTSRAGLEQPNRPIGVFLLTGPSGVGKTETAHALAEILFGGEQNLITINMSEYQEAHTVSTLKGAPPGYVGYGEGGVLTEAVRRRPYSVVLLDEVEKAHPDVHEIFFQVFDKGWMEDGEGRYIDFKNALILLTSNVGSELIASMCADPELLPDPAALVKALRPQLLKVFPAALLGRVVTIPYHPLSDDMLRRIIRLQLDRIGTRVADNHGIDFEYDEKVLELIKARCTEIESGGRMIDAILTNTVLPAMSRELLGRKGAGAPIRRIAVSAADGDFRYSFS